MEPTVEQARHALDEYNATYAAGGECQYPHWAAELLNKRATQEVQSNDAVKQASSTEEKLTDEQILSFAESADLVYKNENGEYLPLWQNDVDLRPLILSFAGALSAQLGQRLPGSAQTDPIKLIYEAPPCAYFAGSPPVSGPFTMSESADGDCFKDIHRPGHGGFMRIVWCSEEDALAKERNPKCESVAHFVLDAINRAAGHAPDFSVAAAQAVEPATPNMYRMLSRRIGSEKWEHEGRMWVAGLPEEFLLEYCRQPNPIREYKIQYGFAADPQSESGALPCVTGKGIDAQVAQEYMEAATAVMKADERGPWSGAFKHPLSERLAADRRYIDARDALSLAIAETGRG